MATYLELATIQDQAGYGDLQRRIRTAVVIKAVSLLDLATPTAAQVSWAAGALANPSAAAEQVVWYVLGANSSAAVTAILSAGDNAVQSNVNAAADAIISGSV